MSIARRASSNIVALLLTPNRLSVIVTLTFAAIGVSQQSWAEGDTLHRCVNDGPTVTDDGARLIEILRADLPADQPCKVIYRPEFDSDTLGTVAWQNMDSIGACYAKAEEVIRQLVEEGWACTQSSKGQSIATQTVQEDAALDVSELQTQSVDSVTETTNFSVYPDLAPPSDELRELIETDLNSLDARLDGRLQAMVAGYGDLNDDEVDDVLVLFTYQSPKPIHRQFLAAYMHDGEAYRLTATKPIGGYASDTGDAKVETIDRGVVHLTLQAFEPGDQSCCPSGRRTLALALRDLEFIEIDADGPTR